MNKDKKVVLITGASRGIGAETAKLLAENNYFVCINYHSNKEKAVELAKNIYEFGGSCELFQADISKEECVFEMVNSIRKSYGFIYSVVNNASYNSTYDNFENIKSEEFKKIFSVNVYGIFFVIKHTIPHMKLLKNGVIINISSESAIYGGNYISPYAASKGAINSLTKGLSRELAKHNIRVNVVSPGIIDTHLHHNENIILSIPLGRMGHPLDVAHAILWLISDHASYISGIVLSVNGAR